MDDFTSLRICPKCDCALCFESAAEPLTFSSWLIVVQCPNCWHAWTRTVNDRVLQQFELALDDDTAAIEAAVDELALDVELATAMQVAAEIARFSAALEADAIMPMDF
jgi:hypothetical protein